MDNFIIVAVLVLVIGGAVAYVVKAKKNGAKCIGCPDGAKCSGNCSGCTGNCGGCSGSENKQ